MASHPLNLVFRFILELSAIFSAGLWGWNTGQGWLKFIYALGIPVLLAAVWGTFNVPGDPSRSGKAPIVIPGFIRLLIELCVFSFGIWALWDISYFKISISLGILVILHFLLSYDRIKWLLAR